MGVQKGRIKQSIAGWCYMMEGEKWSLDELCEITKALNVPAVEIMEISDFPTIKKHGLICSMTNSHLFVKGMNNPIWHDECIGQMRVAIDATSAEGWPNVITFPGFYDTTAEGGSRVDYDEGVKNCVDGYKKIVGYAEERNVTLCLEVLNTRDTAEMKGHPGYMGDSCDTCVEIISKVGSPALKLLFDVYHVQIMEGDIIRRIHELKDVIAHVHIAGNPGRHEIDDSQEINYPAVMQAFADIDYEGYVAHEWIPTGPDVKNTLTEAVTLCDV